MAQGEGGGGNFAGTGGYGGQFGGAGGAQNQNANGGSGGGYGNPTNVGGGTMSNAQLGGMLQGQLNQPGGWNNLTQQQKVSARQLGLNPQVQQQGTVSQNATGNTVTPTTPPPRRTRRNPVTGAIEYVPDTVAPIDPITGTPIPAPPHRFNPDEPDRWFGTTDERDIPGKGIPGFDDRLNEGEGGGGPGGFSGNYGGATRSLSTGGNTNINKTGPQVGPKGNFGDARPSGDNMQMNMMAPGGAEALGGMRPDQARDMFELQRRYGGRGGQPGMGGRPGMGQYGQGGRFGQGGPHPGMNPGQRGPRLQDWLAQRQGGNPAMQAWRDARPQRPEDWDPSMRPEFRQDMQDWRQARPGYGQGGGLDGNRPGMADDSNRPMPNPDGTWGPPGGGGRGDAPINPALARFSNPADYQAALQAWNAYQQGGGGAGRAPGGRPLGGGQPGAGGLPGPGSATQPPPGGGTLPPGPGQAPTTGGNNQWGFGGSGMGIQGILQALQQRLGQGGGGQFGQGLQQFAQSPFGQQLQQKFAASPFGQSPFGQQLQQGFGQLTGGQPGATA